MSSYRRSPHVLTTVRKLYRGKSVAPCTGCQPLVHCTLGLGLNTLHVEAGSHILTAPGASRPALHRFALMH